MTTPFRDRLLRLRKETSVVEPAPGLPAWFLDSARARDARRVGVPPSVETSGRATRGSPKELAEFSHELGLYAARITFFPSAHRHGATELSAVDAAERATWSLLTGDAALASLDPRRAIYLDIETTGLSGGAGTKSFLVGLGRFVDDRFELWQGFLRGPEEEPALLAACADRLRAATGVISFFGKTFDRHRLEDKMRMFRIPPPFAERAHFDLFHPCRRLYASVFANTRLATLERELCGVQRESDLPGSFAPAAWFDFLAGRAHLLEDVFRHNADDILSLVTLAAHLGRAREVAPISPGTSSSFGPHDVARARGLARLCAREKRWSECVEWTRCTRAWNASSSNDRELDLLEDDALRRLGRDGERIELLVSIAGSATDPTAARAAFELALLLAESDPDRSAAARELAHRLAEANLDAPRMRGILRRLSRTPTKGSETVARVPSDANFDDARSADVTPT